MRSLVLIGLLYAGMASMAGAVNAPAYILADIPHATMVGEGVLRWFGLRIYDARLWAANGQYGEDAPHALQLTYSRDFPATSLEAEGLRQMEKQGVEPDKLERWRPLMRSVLLSVKKGDTLTVLQQDDASLRFFHNGRLIKTTHDIEFNRRFLDIWLSKKTTVPELRFQLIGKHN